MVSRNRGHLLLLISLEKSTGLVPAPFDEFGGFVVEVNTSRCGVVNEEFYHREKVDEYSGFL